MRNKICRDTIHTFIVINSLWSTYFFDNLSAKYLCIGKVKRWAVTHYFHTFNGFHLNKNKRHKFSPLLYHYFTNIEERLRTSKPLRLYLIVDFRVLVQVCIQDLTHFRAITTRGNTVTKNIIYMQSILCVCSKVIPFNVHLQLSLENDYQNGEAHPNCNTIRQTQEEGCQERDNPYTL